MKYQDIQRNYGRQKFKPKAVGKDTLRQSSNSKPIEVKEKVVL